MAWISIVCNDCHTETEELLPPCYIEKDDFSDTPLEGKVRFYGNKDYKIIYEKLTDEQKKDYDEAQKLIEEDPWATLENTFLKKYGVISKADRYAPYNEPVTCPVCGSTNCDWFCSKF